MGDDEGIAAAGGWNGGLDTAIIQVNRGCKEA
jgi:hypothetical protein